MAFVQLLSRIAYSAIGILTHKQMSELIAELFKVLIKSALR
jgi:hypothetical protein